MLTEKYDLSETSSGTFKAIDLGVTRCGFGGKLTRIGRSCRLWLAVVALRLN